MPLLDLRGMRLCQIEDGPIRSVGIVRRKGSPLSPIAEKALEEVRAAAGKLVRHLPAWIHPPAPSP
jgi:hypothetical protein